MYLKYNTATNIQRNKFMKQQDDSIETEDQNKGSIATITDNMTDKQAHNDTDVLVCTGSYEYMIQQFHIKQS